MKAPPYIVLAGVAGAGKTTVGQALAGRLCVPFLDADDFHPVGNVLRMARGVPLDEPSRGPWLDAIHHELRARAAAGQGFVLACSALRAVHRRRLAAELPPLVWVHLEVDAATLQQRLAARAGHFFAPGLLADQLATWEPLADGITIAADGPPAAVVAAIVARLPGPARGTFPSP